MYEQIANELKSQYSLGYVSTNAATDGAWRRLQVISKASGTEIPNPARILRPAPRPSIAPAPLVSPRKIRAFGLVVLIAFASCSRAPARSNVLLITIDTLRADRLGAYGNESGLTPNLDRLARAGIVFENAGSAAPLTLPAHASILTGTYPLHHGIRDNGGYHLGEENVTLAETLASHGYRTGAFVGAFVLDSRWGLDQGFERYFDDFDFASFDDVSLGLVSRPGDEVVAEALRFLSEAKAGPFFAWVHLYDPHAPYDPPEPYRGRHGQGRFGLYDGEVAHTDELVGRLVAWLSRESLEEETVVSGHRRLRRVPGRARRARPRVLPLRRDDEGSFHY